MLRHNGRLSGSSPALTAKQIHMNNDEFEFEKSYWGDCTNTFDEDQKHYVYAKYMGLESEGFSFNVNNKRILDVGGGPTSMLLKSKNLKEGLVWDPLEYPDWTTARYAVKNIKIKVEFGELLDETGWDEVWMYNCLQHTQDPAKIIENCLNSAKVFRIFEWIDIPPHEGHPQMITQKLLDDAIGYPGEIVQLSESGCYGTAYYNTIHI